MKCKSCNHNNAVIHPTYGVLWCTDCRKKHHPQHVPNSTIEFTSESIKEQRKAYITDTLPWHRSGQLDRGAIDRYGIDAVRKRGYTDSEIKFSTYVWDGARDISYYKK